MATDIEKRAAAYWAERVQVGIPWRAKSSRLEAFQRTVEWYEGHGFWTIAADSTRSLNRPFNLAAARNHLVRERLQSPVMVLSDADTVPELPALLEAIEEASRDGLVHLPYHLYRNTSGSYVEGATSGIYVFTREAWESTNGQDEHFEGWGYEDSSWRLAHLTLNGPIPQHRGTAVAETHPPAPRDRVNPNRDRYKLYARAYGDVEAMQALAFQARAQEPLDHAARYARAQQTIARQRVIRRGGS